MQNDFVRVGALLEVPEARATIPRHELLLSACREMHIPVIYTKFVAGEETPRESSKRGYRTTIISDADFSYMPDLTPRDERTSLSSLGGSLQRRR